MKRKFTGFQFLTGVILLLVFGQSSRAQDPGQFLIPAAGFARIEENHGTAFALSYQHRLKSSPFFALLSFKHLNIGVTEVVVSPASPPGNGQAFTAPKTPVGRVSVLSLGLRYGKYFYLAPRLNLVSGNNDYWLGWGITGGLQIPIGKGFALGYRLEYDRGGQNYQDNLPLTLESYTLLFEIYLPLHPKQKGLVK